MCKYKHIIWDWNGTLLDDAWLCVVVMNILLKKRNLNPIDLKKYQTVFGFPIIDYYRKLGFTFDDEPFQKPGTEFILEYNKRYIESKLQKDALPTLKYIQKCNINQSILSAQEKKQLNTFMKHFNLSKYFNNVFGLNNHYADGKIEAGEKLLQKIDRPINEILIIGDTVYDYDVSVALGIDCVLIHRNHQLKSTLTKTGAPTFNSLSDILKHIKC